MEHVSITVLFIGGGLCGMLVESTRIRDLLNYTVADAAQGEEGQGQYPAYRDDDVDEEQQRRPPGPEVLREPETYAFSMNPIPALVILLLGIMMSSHTQDSMISSMVHKQWGNLLTGASFARGLTYVLAWLRPPRSVYPSRPPTELLTAFGLISGGIIFMASVSFYVFFTFYFLRRSLDKKKKNTQADVLTTVERYRRRHDPLPARRHVHVHRHHGSGRPAHGLGHPARRPQGLGRQARERPRPLALRKQASGAQLPYCNHLAVIREVTRASFLVLPPLRFLAKDASLTVPSPSFPLPRPAIRGR